jgi:hypothetical protein
MAANGMMGAGSAAGNGSLYAAGGANSLLDPYMANGAQAATSLSQFMGQGGAGSTPFNASMMEANDPGYQFRLDQGQQALDRSASAHGSVMGGGQMKALTDYAQGAASSEYQNAFNRYTTQNQNQFNNLSSMSNQGQAASTQAGNNMQNAAQYAGNAGMNSALAAGNFNTNAAQYASNLGMAGAEYGGNADMSAAQYAGNAGMAGAQYNGDASINGTRLQSGNIMQGSQYVGNTQIGAGNAAAAGTLGRSAAWNTMLGNLGKNATDFASMLAGG